MSERTTNLRLEVSEALGTVSEAVSQLDELTGDGHAEIGLGHEVGLQVAESCTDDLESDVKVVRRTGAYYVTAVIPEGLVGATLHLELSIVDGSLQVLQRCLNAHSSSVQGSDGAAERLTAQHRPALAGDRRSA